MCVFLCMRGVLAQDTLCVCVFLCMCAVYACTGHLAACGIATVNKLMSHDVARAVTTLVTSPLQVRQPKTHSAQPMHSIHAPR